MAVRKTDDEPVPADDDADEDLTDLNARIAKAASATVDAAGRHPAGPSSD